MGKKQVILSDKLAPVRARMAYAQAIRAGNTIYVSGQVARNREHIICHKRDAVGQLDMVFQNMKDVLEVASATMQDVIKLNFFCRDIWDMADMIPVLRKYFGEHTPARSTVQVAQLAHPHLLVEVEAIAVVGEDQVIIDGKK